MRAVVFEGSPNDPSVQMTIEAVERLLQINLEVSAGSLSLVGSKSPKQGCRDCSNAYSRFGHFGCDIDPHDVR